VSLFLDYHAYQGYNVAPKVTRLLQSLKDGADAVKASGIAPSEFSNVKKVSIVDHINRHSSNANPVLDVLFTVELLQA
jgi:hypothetical protein